jgi:hypothetical protein
VINIAHNARNISQHQRSAGVQRFTQGFVSLGNPYLRG